MEISQFGPDDADEVRHFVAVTNAVSRVDSPWGHPMTEEGCAGSLRHGWDGEPQIPFLGVVDGNVAALAEYSTSEWDNRHLAWLWVGVHPDFRGRGLGSEMLDTLLERARAEGRTSVGMDGWDSDAARAFATSHGFEQKSQAINRRQSLVDVDWAIVDALYDEAATTAASYELVRRFGVTPDDELEALAVMTAAINDAPTDDLDIEDEVFPAERVRNYENAQVARGMALHRVFARHRETGELAGQTVIVVAGDQPQYAHQHDTSVVRAHRGHQLGLLLKVDMLRWIREQQPQVESVDTWNAESNDHMIDVNERLAYTIMGRGLQFQRSV